MVGFPLSDWNEDTTVFLFFVIVALIAFTGGVSPGENPLVWGSALFLGVVFAVNGVFLGAGLGLLLPVLLLGILLYFQVLGKLVGDGMIAWIMCAFVIMLLAGAGLA